MAQVLRSAGAGVEAVWAPSLAAMLMGSRGGLAVDFDGTISPIAPSPDAAAIDSACQAALAALAERLPFVAVVSGRPVDDLRHRVGLDELTYVGCHGGEWWPSDHRGAPAPSGPASVEVAAMQRRIAVLIAEEGALDGVFFERKPTGLAVHFRQAAHPVRAARAIARAIRRADAAALGLVPLWGKCVIELRPANAPTKGTALAAMVEHARLDSIVYLGDDRTDADAFRVIRRLRSERGVRALGIAVAGPETPAVVLQWADVEIDGVGAVATLLGLLAGSTAAVSTARLLDTARSIGYTDG